MKYVKRFKQLSDYQAFIGGGGYTEPLVSFVNETNKISLFPYKTKVGDIAYWNGHGVSTISLKDYSASMGQAIGVVVVPEGFALDGKARICGLYNVDTNGNKVTSKVYIAWGPKGVNTSLTNYTAVPTTDNNGSTSIGSNSIGYLPSDEFTGSTSYVDSKAKYYGSDRTPYSPSPYLGEKPNPEYYKTLSGNNVLSDFNGLSNTQTLVDLGSNYKAANAAWKYKDGSSSLQWYLPGMGEFGYLIPRFNEINNTINSLGGLTVAGDSSFWSSSEYGSDSVRFLYTGNGAIYNSSKDDNLSVRPFSILN